MDQAANRAGEWLALTMTRRYDVPPESVFRAWTDPAQLAQWLGVPGRQTHVEAFDARVGAAYRISFSGGDMPTTVVHGRFEEVEAPSRLVFSWQWERGPAGLPEEETLVTVTFRAAGAATEMVLTHAGFGSQEWRARHEHGWNCGLDNLAAFTARPVQGRAGMAQEDNIALAVRRRFAAPIEAVFRAWIEPEQLAGWIGPRHVQARIDALDARVGGSYRISFLDGEGIRQVVGGIFREITPPKRLVMSWTWESPCPGQASSVSSKIGHETLITVLLETVGKETELTLTHERFPDQPTRDGHDQGWNGSFDKLAELLAA